VLRVVFQEGGTEDVRKGGGEGLSGPRASTCRFEAGDETEDWEQSRAFGGLGGHLEEAISSLELCTAA